LVAVQAASNQRLLASIKELVMLKKRTQIVSILAFPIVATLVLIVGLRPFSTQAAPEATISVQNVNDSGPGSLRQTIADANNGDTIIFDASLSGQTIILVSELEINKNLSINGTVPITISGNNATRVFNVNGTNLNVTFDHLTIANGNVQTTDCGSASERCGGGIMIQNSSITVTVMHSTLISNTAGLGGGLYNASGTATVSVSALFGNTADGTGGGGLFNYYGTMTVSSSALSGNTANLGGGGLFNFHGTATVSASLLSGNTAVYGGGLFNDFGTVTIITSTLSGNTASEFGGGLYNDSGTATVGVSTFFGNTAGDTGGGIRSYYGTTRLSNSIIANSLNGSDCDHLGGSGIISNGYNLDSDGSCGLTSIGDLPNTDPQLDALADNGGPTLTHALLPGNPIIDAGNCANGPATDQRGVPRPRGDNCDIGAYESRGFTLTSTGGTPREAAVNTAFANPLALTVSSGYGEPVDGGMVTFTAPLSGAGLTFTETVAFISDGAVSLLVTANGVAGSYVVTANTNGSFSGAVDYNLTNLFRTFMPIVMMSGEPD
jgi:hypothetical protein